MQKKPILGRAKLASTKHCEEQVILVHSVSRAKILEMTVQEKEMDDGLDVTDWNNERKEGKDNAEEER